MMISYDKEALNCDVLDLVEALRETIENNTFE